MANYREKMREYLKEPNEYSSQYGKWGALNAEQRKLIRRLLDEMDSADIVIKKQYEGKQKLIKFLEDKIYRQELLLKDWKMDTYNYNYQKGIQFAYKNVLDFIMEGGKE